MSTSESFKNVIGGRLNLKGGSAPVKGGVKKKKKANAESLALALASGEGGAAETSPPSKPKEDKRTDAERRHDEKAQKAEERIIAAMASKSSKEKVQGFNSYLSKISEHYDIPRVGPG